MADELQVPEDKGDEQRPQTVCDRDRVLSTLGIVEKGAKQAFLDNELGVEETKTILDQIRQAKEACEAGDENACAVLDNLMSRLTRR